MENVIIIGGGPAGLSAAIYLARAELKPLIIEGKTPGGQLMLTSEVENYPGFPDGIYGNELIAKFKKQAERFGTKFITEDVKQIENQNSKKIVELQAGKILETKAILIATGAEAMWLNLESEQKLRGKGVSACAICDGFFFRGKTVAVIGGGDVALEDALALTKFTKKVYLIHRRNEFRASKIMQDRVFKNSIIEVIWNSEVVQVLGTDKVEGIKLKTTSSKNIDTHVLDLQGLFVAIGHKPLTKFLDGSGVNLDNRGYIYTTSGVAYDSMKTGILNKDLNKVDYDLNFQYATNVKGIFAAGDCVDAIYRQAATAVGTGVSASLEIEKYLEENS